MFRIFAPNHLLHYFKTYAFSLQYEKKFLVFKVVKIFAAKI